MLYAVCLLDVLILVRKVLVYCSCCGCCMPLPLLFLDDALRYVCLRCCVFGGKTECFVSYESAVMQRNGYGNSGLLGVARRDLFSNTHIKMLC